MAETEREFLPENESPQPSADASDAFRSELYSDDIGTVSKPRGGGKGSAGLEDAKVDVAFGRPEIKDAGKQEKEAEINRDGSGRPLEIISPWGDKTEITYDDSGKVSRVTITHPSGKPEILERTEKGWWKINGEVDHDLSKIEVLTDGSVKRTHHRDGVLVVHPDGTAEGRDIYDRVNLKVDKDGTRTSYHYEDRVTTFGTRLVEKPGSQFAEIFSTFGTAFKDGCQFTHKNGDKERLERKGLTWEFTRGGKRETLPEGTKVEIEPSGDRKFTRPDGSSFEGKANGTTISRNREGQVTEITSPDGITTSFHLGDKGKVTGVDVRDSSGRLIESDRLSGDSWQSNLTDASGKPQNLKKVEVDNKTGKYTLTLENGRLVRSADGTEDQKDSAGRPVDAYDDKVVSWMKRADLELSPQEEATLRADLAVINKLPPEKKAWILLSMDRIINGNTDAKTELSKAQRSELARSLAHQIAHPESITQGGKRGAVTASAERMMATTRPDDYARMVADLAVDGKYTTRDGKTVKVQMTRDGFLDGKSDDYHQRTLTSELFQNAATNIALEREGKTYRSYPADAPELKPAPAGVDPLLDTGERVVDREGRVTAFEGLNPEQRKALLGSLGVDGHDLGSVSSAKELVDAWNARQDKNAPLTIAVGVPNEKYHFWQQWHTSPEVNRQHHVLTITHIDTSTDPPMVYFDNTAGGENHTYPGGTAVVGWDIISAHKAVQR